MLLNNLRLGGRDACVMHSIVESAGIASWHRGVFRGLAGKTDERFALRLFFELFIPGEPRETVSPSMPLAGKHVAAALRT